MESKHYAGEAYRAMLFNGICASSGGVVVALLQEYCGLDYQWSGLLLAALSVGHLLSTAAAGVLPGRIGLPATIRTLSLGAALGYGIMTFARSPWALLLAFALVGAAKGSTLNVSSVLAGTAPDKTRSMNLMHACFATGSLACPVLIAALGAGGRPWWTPMAGLAVCGVLLWGVFALGRLPKPAGGAEHTGRDWSFLKKRRFWLLTGLLFFQNSAEIGITGWMVTYFKDTGILAGPAGQLTVTVIWGAMLAGRLVIAFLLHIRSVPKALLLMTTASAGTYVLLLAVKTPLAALGALALFGLAIAGVNPTAVAGAGKMLSSESMGVMLPMAGVGAVLMPYITGAVAEVAGIHAGMAAILLAVIGMAVCAAALCWEERRRTRTTA